MRSLNFPYNPRIDEIRWLAATLVFAFHFYQRFFNPGVLTLSHPGWSWFNIISEGHTGVGLFFTLSGFLFMQIALHHKKIVYGDFIRNRFLRIFPLFLTVFVIAISIDRDAFRPQDVFYILFTNLGDAPTSKIFLTGAAWTISVEFMFYLAFPFLGRFTVELGARYLLQLLALLFVVKLAAYGVSERSTHMFFSTLVGRFDQFLIGMLAACVYARYRATLQRFGGMWLLAATLLVLLNSMVQGRYASLFLPEPKQAFWITWSMQESAAWAMFIMAWLAADLRKPQWLSRLLQQGGEISFSFYLLHALVIALLQSWLGTPRPTGNIFIDSLGLFALIYGVTWVVAMLGYHSIEAPFLRLRHRYGR
jgi:peptidoglycan/LPS O-acetylase OafA/YrhL